MALFVNPVVIAIVYTSIVALAQEDMKKLIAYSSVAHMGYVTLGIFLAQRYGVQGAIFQMLSHGVILRALFLIVGVVYDRMHTRDDLPLWRYRATGCRAIAIIHAVHDGFRGSARDRWFRG